MPETLVTIRLDALRHNISLLRDIAGRPANFCVAVKANAYGHGISEVAAAAVEAGATHLGVARADEALRLGGDGLGSRVIIMANAASVEPGTIAASGAGCFAGDLESLRALEEEGATLAARAGSLPIGDSSVRSGPQVRAGADLPTDPSRARATNSPAAAASAAPRKIKVHLKIDTGMRRLGCEPGDAAELAQAIRDSQHLELAGIATHLAVADSYDPADVEFTALQIRLFEEAVATVRARGIDPGILHLRNSAALCTGVGNPGPEDMPRPGIAVYGYHASPALEKALAASIPLRPVMTMYSRLVRIRRVEAGVGVSYGRRFRAPGPRWIGTLPAGYGDGLPRTASGTLNFVHIPSGETVPQIGTICMDLCMVDLGPAGEGRAPRIGGREVRIHDIVGIFGEGLAETASTVAAKAGTIPYEITSGISARIPRICLQAQPSPDELALLW